ncbi:MAG: acyl-ACP--UDP-N-acetylglucosamine O-acyltransferase [Verrucomicrobiota bacterium JB023]|nr:acyl-ACP--UDP-N-acetylglucosamine O-acyltransferase [Verrucomicrobiota bacterium JB023]
MAIHPTAVISPKAEIGEHCEIGPFCVIGDGVTLGDHARLHSHVVIERNTRIGTHCEAFPFAALGGKTQDLKYESEPTFLEIGNHNTFRENVTVHRSTRADTVTRIGDHNLFLCYAHVAHECQVGNHTIFSNNATIAGHVTVEDHAIISGLAAIHQFCRVGQHAMVGGLARIISDVAPFTIVEGSPAHTRSLNLVGLQRRGFSEEDIRSLKTAYKHLFLKKELNFEQQLLKLGEHEHAANPQVQALLEFIGKTQRGITR